MSFQLIEKGEGRKNRLEKNIVSIQSHGIYLGSGFRDFLCEDFIAVYIDFEEKKLALKPTKNKEKGFKLRN